MWKQRGLKKLRFLIDYVGNDVVQNQGEVNDNIVQSQGEVNDSIVQNQGMLEKVSGYLVQNQ